MMESSVFAVKSLQFYMLHTSLDSEKSQGQHPQILLLLHKRAQDSSDVSFIYKYMNRGKMAQSQQSLRHPENKVCIYWFHVFLHCFESEFSKEFAKEKNEMIPSCKGIPIYKRPQETTEEGKGHGSEDKQEPLQQTLAGKLPGSLATVRAQGTP